MSVLALDLGRRVGWARSDGRSGCFDTREWDDHGQALALFHDWMTAMIDELPLIYLAVERGFGGNNANGRLTTSMELTAHSLAWSRDVPRTDRGADQVRKALLGFARVSPKVESSKAARTRLLDKAVMAAVRGYGFEPSSEHAADAAALLLVVEGRAQMATAV